MFKVMATNIGVKEVNSITHYLKSFIDRFELLWENKVRAEIRSLDIKRNYKVGDNCYLIEGYSDMGIWIPTQRVLSLKIKHLDLHGVAPGNVLIHYDLLLKIKVTDIEEVIKTLPDF